MDGQGPQLAVVTADVDHDARPDPTTARRRGDLPASLKDMNDYPVNAMCADCGQPVRAESYYTPFVHTGRKPGDPW